MDHISTNRQTMSLIEDSVDIASQSNEDLDSTSDQSSVSRRDSGRDSMWSPASALEADEDASLRPLPPSSPPSPSPSRSSSSYLSNPRTFRSIAASTKPTTLLSIDLHGNGMAHIAQAPVTPTSYRHHARNSSTATNPTLLTQRSVHHLLGPSTLITLVAKFIYPDKCVHFISSSAAPYYPSTLEIILGLHHRLLDNAYGTDPSHHLRMQIPGFYGHHPRHAGILCRTMAVLMWRAGANLCWATISMSGMSMPVLGH